MRRGLLIAAVVAFIAVSPAGLGEDRTLSLTCVDKIGENMYRAKNKTVVWTEHCSHEAKCENATVRIGSESRITWSDGSYCWVLKVAER
jgi:hypothetical protein